VGLVEATGRGYGIEFPIQMTVATTNGEQLWVFRYSSERQSRSLFYTAAVQELRQRYPQNSLFRRLSDHTRLVMSEPLGDLPDAWNEVPDSSCGVVNQGHDDFEPFVPKPPCTQGIAPPGA
ncbi:MAG: class II glutamine amidotransferase, partial [Betaproteobacteria bacterium]|nr:class II glutamine amidotransferase [Betaproteobacteria bacterium]